MTRTINLSQLDTFIAASPYKAPVDIKKLQFIFSSIVDYTTLRGKSFEELHILEVGCGRGGITLPIASLGCQTMAFDINKNSIEWLQSQINLKKIKNLVVTVGDGHLFCDDKKYDIIIASEVFEHVLNPTKLAENIVKQMGKGSYLIVTVPNGYGPWELKNRLSPLTYLRKWNLLRRLLGKPMYVFGSGDDHCQFYTKVAILKLFSDFSLKLIKFQKSDSFLTIFSPLRNNRFLGRFDIILAEILPYQLASGFYFTFELI